MKRNPATTPSRNRKLTLRSKKPRISQQSALPDSSFDLLSPTPTMKALSTDQEFKISPPLLYNDDSNCNLDITWDYGPASSTPIRKSTPFFHLENVLRTLPKVDSPNVPKMCFTSMTTNTSRPTSKKKKQEANQSDISHLRELAAKLHSSTSSKTSESTMNTLSVSPAVACDQSSNDKLACSETNYGTTSNCSLLNDSFFDHGSLLKCLFDPFDDPEQDNTTCLSNTGGSKTTTQLTNPLTSNDSNQDILIPRPPPPPVHQSHPFTQSNNCATNFLSSNFASTCNESTSKPNQSLNPRTQTIRLIPKPDFHMRSRIPQLDQSCIHSHSNNHTSINNTVRHSNTKNIYSSNPHSNDSIPKTVHSSNPRSNNSIPKTVNPRFHSNSLKPEHSYIESTANFDDDDDDDRLFWMQVINKIEADNLDKVDLPPTSTDTNHRSPLKQTCSQDDIQRKRLVAKKKLQTKYKSY